MKNNLNKNTMQDRDDTQESADSDSSPKKDLLIEIGCEELPPTHQPDLIRQFQSLIESGLKRAELDFESIKGFISPRRFAVLVKGLDSQQKVRIVTKKGPSQKAAFDETGKPTKALQGFMDSCGITLEQIKEKTFENGVFIIFEQVKTGDRAETLVPKIVEEALIALPLPKRMRWGTREESFLRPIHWIVMLLGEEVIPATVFGIKADRKTYGHRFLHPEEIVLRRPDEYEETLEKVGKVIVDFTKRKNRIIEEINTIIASKKILHHSPSDNLDYKFLKDIADNLEKPNKNFQAIIDPSLLDENTGLVEWPVVILGKFDHKFLNLPREVLISTMQYHQKCFATESIFTTKKIENKIIIPKPAQKNKLILEIQNTDTVSTDFSKNSILTNHFILISNIETNDPSQIIDGNKRVMQARLEDAEFHYSFDKKHSLESRREALKKVIFQAGLGSLWDKSERMKQLGGSIGETIQKSISITDITRAAELCKTDLLTQMVGEFPELQGIMGRYYALHDKESETVANAIAEYYHPRFANDHLPASTEGDALALSERIDTLVGIFGIGKRPTSEKDPFGLRRHALSILRILIEKKYDLDLTELFTYSENLFASPSIKLTHRNMSDDLIQFCYERLRAWYVEKGYSPKFFEAVSVKNITRPYDFDKRIKAVAEFSKLSESETLSAANKRVQNILVKSNIEFAKIPSINSDLLKEPAEKKLAQALKSKQKEVLPLLDKTSYTDAFKSLAELREPIDQFFNEVMVMVEDEALKNNRLALLKTIRSLFLEIADISVL